MTTVQARTNPGRSLGRGALPTGSAATWWFASAGVVMLVWEAVTLTRWASRGHAHPITAFRDRTLVSWTAAHVFEVVFLALTVALVWHVVRAAVRQRRVTLDVMLLVGLFTSAWLDPAFMFYRQIFLYSSQFLNVRAWCGDMPGVLNSECGQTAEPLIVPLLYVDVLMVAMLAGWVIRRLRPRYPRWSLGRTLLTAGLVGAVFDMVMEIPVIHLDLWKYASGPDWLAPPGLQGDARYSLTTAFTFGLITAGVTALRVHRNDRGESLLERRGGTGSTARLLTVLAVIGYAQLTVVASFVPAMAAAPYSPAWGHYPAQLTNGMCDNNTGTGPTPYPCAPAAVK